MPNKGIDKTKEISKGREKRNETVETLEEIKQ
jgi:hypothetical protein